MIAALFAALCLFASILPAGAGSFFKGQASTPAATFAGPCDLTTCAETYSVDRAMKNSYSGPLFQLYNGTTTMDVGQTTSRAADITGVSTFCGGVPGTCVYAKVYGQIQGHNNDLVPSTINAPNGPNCSTGGTYQCAAPYAIEAATGLPILNTTYPQEYALLNDQGATGITGTGSSSSSIFYNGTFVTNNQYCCGVFGISHQSTAGNTTGTDFILLAGFGNSGFADCCCLTPTTYCFGIDEEGAGDSVDVGTTKISLAAFVTYDKASNAVAGTLNGRSVFSASPPNATLNSGTSVHLGGGGDLSGPAPVTFREGFIANSVVSGTQQSDILNNTTAFFSQVSYP